MYFAFIHLHNSIWYNFEYINIHNEFDFGWIAWQISTLTKIQSTKSKKDYKSWHFERLALPLDKN